MTTEIQNFFAEQFPDVAPPVAPVLVAAAGVPSGAALDPFDDLVEIPGCGITLMGHQREAVRLGRRHARYGFLWEPGCGKTIAILAILADAKAKGEGGKTVVACPKSIMWSAWAADARHFPTLKAVVCWASTPAKRRALIATPDVDLLIINHDGFKSHAEDLLAAGVTRLVFDESSKIRTFASHRKSPTHISNVTFEFSCHVDGVYLLSGTPAPNGEWEYWTQVRCLDPRTFGPSYFAFRSKYFVGTKQQVGWTPGPAMKAVLKNAGMNQLAGGRCLRWQEANQAQGTAAGHLRSPAAIETYFEAGSRAKPELVALIRAMGVTKPMPPAVSDPRKLLGWLAQRAGNPDLRPALFDPFEVEGDFHMIDERREEFVGLLNTVSWTLRASECLDLPEETDEIREVDLSSDELNAYAEALAGLKVQVGDEAVTFDVNARTMKLRQITGGSLYCQDGTRKRIGRAKLDDLLELLEELGNRQLVVWCDFDEEIRRAMDELAAEGVACAEISGRVADPRKRSKNVEDFQSGRLRVLVCHAAAAGHGITLHAARFNYFFSTGFKPEDHEQARRRIYRKGQRWPVVHYYAVARGTIDEQVMKVIKRKATASEAVKELLAKGRKGGIVG